MASAPLEPPSTRCVDAERGRTTAPPEAALAPEKDRLPSWSTAAAHEQISDCSCVGRPMSPIAARMFSYSLESSMPETTYSRPASSAKSAGFLRETSHACFSESTSWLPAAPVESSW